MRFLGLRGAKNRTAFPLVALAPAAALSAAAQNRSVETSLATLTFNHTIGTPEKSGGPYIRNSVSDLFHSGSDSRARVVVNFRDTPQSVEVNLDGLSGNVVVAAPFHADRTAVLPVQVAIPPDRFVVVVKQ